MPNLEAAATTITAKLAKPIFDRQKDDVRADRENDTRYRGWHVVDQSTTSMWSAYTSVT
jgi:hypothetical protein